MIGLAKPIPMVFDVSHTCVGDHVAGLGRRGLAALSAVCGKVGGYVIASAVIVGLTLTSTDTPALCNRAVGRRR